MTRTLTTAIAVVLALTMAACGDDSDSDESDRLADAVCADLDAGLTLVQIHGGVDSPMSSREFAGHVHRAVTGPCPEHADTPGVPLLLENNGYG